MPVGPAPPHVPRETRLLLITLMLSLAALWVLARIRFPERVVSPNPLPPVLTQLSPPAGFDDLAASIFELRPRITASLIPIEVRRENMPGRYTPGKLLALRIRSELAVAVIDDSTELSADENHPAVEIVRRDPASGFAVVRVEPDAAPELRAWAPRQVDYPRFLIVTDPSPEGPSLRPVYVSSLSLVESPLWHESIWLVPPKADLPVGTFVFTTDAALAGLVVEREGRPAIVPGTTVFGEADRLLAEEPKDPGRIGVDVQPLTAAIGTATGASSGVVVTWVDPAGPAAGQLAPTDTVEAIDGDTLLTLEHWQSSMARLTAGKAIVLRVRRSGASDVRDVQLTAGAILGVKDELSLGLTMLAVPRTGVEVLSVGPRSASARAGIQPQDLITLIGDVKAPTPTQVSRAFTRVPEKGSVLVAVTRAGAHLVLVLKKP